MPFPVANPTDYINLARQAGRVGSHVYGYWKNRKQIKNYAKMRWNPPNGGGNGSRPPKGGPIKARGGKRYKKKVYGKRKRKRSFSIPRQLKYLKRQVNNAKYANQAVNVRRASFSGTFASLDNQCSYNGFSFLSSTDVDNMLAATKVQDAVVANTAALTTLDLTLAAINAKITVQSVHTTIHFRNNWSTPLNMTLYWVFPRVHTSENPWTAVTDGLTDKGVSTPTTNILYWPMDSANFRKQWKLNKKVTLRLQAGDEYIAHMVRKKPFKVDQDLKDQHDFTYWRGKSQALMVRMWGIVSHDSINTTTEQGIGSCRVDYVQYEHYRWLYAAGGGTNKGASVSGLNAFTNDAISFGPNIIEIAEKGT